MATRIAYMKTLVIPTVAIAAMSLLGQGRPPTCLRYEPDTVRVTGTLARHIYYGAPGFGEDPKHDQKEVGFYLDLAAPICMAPGSDDVDVAKSGIRRIQLVLDEDGYARLRPLLGKRLTLRGTLFGAITGHHHTPVLLSVVKPVHVER
jgi:hypothetical protein